MTCRNSDGPTYKGYTIINSGEVIILAADALRDYEALSRYKAGAGVQRWKQAVMHDLNVVDLWGKYVMQGSILARKK